MAEKRKFITRAGDAIADVAMMLSGKATPQELRTRNALLERQRSDINPMSDLEMARKGLENDQISTVIQQLKQSLTRGDLDIEGERNVRTATGGFPLEAAQFFEGRPLRDAQLEATKEGTRAVGQQTNEREQTIKELGQTPETSKVRLGEKQVATSALDPLTMMTQYFGDDESKMIPILESAGLDATPYKQRAEQKQAAQKAKLDAITALGAEDEKPAEKEVFAPSLFRNPEAVKRGVSEQRKKLTDEQEALLKKLEQLGTKPGETVSTTRKVAAQFGVPGAGFTPAREEQRGLKELGLLQSKADEYSRRLREISGALQRFEDPNFDPIEFLKSLNPNPQTQKRTQ